MRLEPSKRALLIGAHQQAVADDIRREYCCQFANNRHCFRLAYGSVERRGRDCIVPTNTYQREPVLRQDLVTQTTDGFDNVWRRNAEQQRELISLVS